MRRRVALIRTVVSEERIASVIRVERISELGTLAITRGSILKGSDDGVWHSELPELWIVETGERRLESWI
jgi:hypothetical protein